MWIWWTQCKGYYISAFCIVSLFQFNKEHGFGLSTIISLFQFNKEHGFGLSTIMQHFAVQIWLSHRKGKNMQFKILQLAIKGDLKGWNIPKDLALDRSAWKTTIHMPEPWLLLLGFNSNLPQLVWDLKALLLLLLLLLMLLNIGPTQWKTDHQFSSA